MDAARVPAGATPGAIPGDHSAAATTGRHRASARAGAWPQPQASGPAYTIYDQLSGAFADPAGGTGIFAPGMTGASSAENWVDLMRDPRQL
ncbi:Mce family protein Mce4 [Mycobacterium tuberculosis]|nr:Mce family protein Mce4 [Mycobacterium tuberculosis]